MHLEEFSEGSTFFHQRDPRLKLIVFVPLVCVVAFSHQSHVYVTALCFACGCIAWARINLRSLGARLLAVNSFILFLWVTLGLGTPGTEAFSIGNLVFTHEGLRYAYAITLKANTIFLFTIAFLGTTEIFSLAHALFHLRVPKKLVYLFFFFYRYISVLHEEYDILLAAAKARGFIAKTNKHTFKTYAYMAGMLFVNSYERSQRIYNALILRGFRGDFPLSKHFKVNKQDVLFVVIVSGAIISLLPVWK